ncbi:MAG: glycoside hydrolase family 3 C-terminal domain-containing protein [Bacilli bacterium]|nr:glycoside hydrolase family 3 C-terminal domain-containing protein [Bacilli bacterium]
MKKKTLAPLFLTGMVLPLALAAGMSGKDAARASAAYIGEYGERAAYIEHATKVNGQMADEGFVLLKNDGSLPLAKGSKISVVGKSSTNLARGGAGSGAGSVSSGVTSVNLQDSLTDAGFEINNTLTDFYKDDKRSGPGRTNGNDGWKGNSEVTIGETPWTSYTDAIKDSIYEYSDAVIQVLTREGSEGCDVLTADATDSVKFGSSEKHALQLSDNEQELFDNLHDFTEHIIIVINSSNIFECDQFMNDDKVAGILWIGNPGDVGPGAVGRILCGDVNPSGHTVDTWTRDFSKDPTWQNFSDNRHTNVAIPNTSNRLKHAAQDTMFAADGSPMLSYGSDKNYSKHESPRWLEQAQKVVQGGINGVKPAAYVSYEEGIYLDYRYYETRYADMAKEDQAAADAWYNGEEGVVFPFGYGLSYTEFEQEIVRIAPKKNSTLDETSDLIEVGVKVTNTGDVAGKDTVQLYWKAPYTKGGIEKADHVLCAFDKTKTLQPGESQTLHLTFHLQDVANYDFTDANGNGFKGYELDDGTYSVLLNKNAHENYDSVDLKVKDGGIKYENDRFTGNKVENRFTDRGFYSSMPGEDDIEFTQFSRADWDGTFPTHPTIEDRTVKAGSRFEEFLTHEFNIWEIEEDKNFEYQPEAVYRTEDDAVAGGWTQANSTLAKGDRTQLIDMKDVEPDDPKWDEFINEFTWAEMMKFVENNRMSSPSLDQIGKGGFSEGDGPQKFNIMWWVSSPIIAATWNQKLAHEQGECVGMESQITGKAGWWGPGVNTHRSPFGGRNFEYYSADPFLMGRMAAQVVGAATDRGVYAYFKHFAVNDQEKNRESGISFVNEQALREIYLKSFQMVFQEGKSIGVMGSYNRIGLQETAGSYPLMTEVLRGEWGFKGSVLSDMTHSGNGSVNFKCYENVTNRTFAGCNSQLDSSGFNGQTISKWDATATWAGGTGAPVYEHNGKKVIPFSWWNAVRQDVKQTMYMCVNSTGMQRGLTQVVGERDAEVKIGEDFSFNVELPEEYNGKTISSATYELNKRCELPEGLTLSEDGTLSGNLAHVGLYRVDVIANVTYADGTEGTVAYKFVIEAVADPSGMEDDVNPDPEKPKKGCKGSIAATAILVAPIALAAAVVAGKKRKAE